MVEGILTLSEVEQLVERRQATDLILHGGERRKARRDVADEAFDALVATVRALYAGLVVATAEKVRR